MVGDDKLVANKWITVERLQQYGEVHEPVRVFGSKKPIAIGCSVHDEPPTCQLVRMSNMHRNPVRNRESSE